MIVIRGSWVLTPQGLENVDIVIEGDRVIRVGSYPHLRGAEVIDGAGMITGPGLVDLHCHLRDPGETWKEDLESGSRAARAGGFTAVIGMPNTVPAVDNIDLVRDIEERAGQIGLIEVRMAASITVGRLGESLVDLAGLHRGGVRIFTDDGSAVGDEALLRKAMSESAHLEGAVIAEHAEDGALTSGGHLHDEAAAGDPSLARLSVESETSIIERDLGLARETGARLHVQHVSTAAGMAMIGAARVGGTRVTCEVTPHHLSLTDRDIVGADPNFKMYPPLREPGDRAALVDGLGSGVIDVVATDHAPHTPSEKSVGFEAAPRGVIGLETALPLTLAALDGDAVAMFEVLSVRPARLAGLRRQGRRVEQGSPANLVMIDPERRWVVSGFESKSANSPFLGREMRGAVVLTVHEGVPRTPGATV
jgi:dihydroorotase